MAQEKIRIGCSLKAQTNANIIWVWAYWSDIPRVFTSSREQTFGASIFRDPIYHLIKSQSITIKFNQPQYISKLSFQTAIYIQFQSWQILHQSVRKVWNLLCAILWSITTGHHGFYLRWHTMAKVNDNHIQPKSNETPLPPRRRSCFSKKALLRKLSILTLDAIV